MPYAQALLREIARRDREAARELPMAAQARWRSVRVDGIRARELLGVLSAVPCMAMREIARLLTFDAPERLKKGALVIAYTYVRALKAAGLVEIESARDRSGRERWVVRSARPVDGEPRGGVG